MSKRTPKNHKSSHNTPVVLCWHEKFFESNKRQWISFRPQRWDVPYRKPSWLLWEAPVCEKLRFVRSICPNLPKWDKICTTTCWCRSMIACQVSWNFRRVFDLLEFKNEATQCFAGNQRCNGVSNSFPFLAWDLSMHPWTQIWFFNQFICTGACACSSNLNYAHKCIENSVNT